MRPAAATSIPRRRSGQAASSTLLPPGAEVEVRIDDEGFHGLWYEAIAVDFAPAGPARGPAQYALKFVRPLAAGDGGGALKETFPASHVRPRPPPPSESAPPRFHLHDIVEASYCQGWWTGIVMSAPDSASATVTVGFPITRKVLKFPLHLVRPRRDYVDGEWVPSRAAMVVRPERMVQIYEVGDKVEVKSHLPLYGEPWIPATVVRVVDDLSYVVEYTYLNGGACGEEMATESEYVHCQFMRKVPNNSNGNKRRKVGDKIMSMSGETEMILLKMETERRQSVSGGSPSSPVDVASSGDEHSHDPESPATEKARKNLKEVDGILAEGLEHGPLKMDTPLSDRNKIASIDRVCADNSAAQVAKSSHDMKTATPSPDYRVQKAGVGEVDQHAGEKLDDSFVLSCPQNSGSPQSTIENSPLKGCSATESSLPSPMALSNTSDRLPLFVKRSSQWAQIEATDVFSVYPQRPHFLPLKKFPQIMHEGMALGLMTVFSDLVSIIKKASIRKSMEWFEDKFSTLRHLEEHGFSVESLHSTLSKLVKIKSQHTIYLGKMAKLDVEIDEETASLTRIGGLLDEKDRALGELEQEIQKLAKEKENKEKELWCLRQELQKLAEDKENKETELPRLKSEQSKFREAYADVEHEFHSVLAPLPGSS